MQPSVSEFTLHPESRPPTVPSLIRSRHQASTPSEQPQIIMKEIIVQVKNSLNISKHNSRASHIRTQIDSCLNAIEGSWKAQHDGEYAKLGQEGTPTKSNNIHRVDNRLILEYLQTVCGQYSFEQKFLKKGEARKNNFLKDSPKTPNYSRMRPTSVEGTSRGKKQYLQLTQASKQARRGHSTFKKPLTIVPSYIPKRFDQKSKLGYCLSCEQAVQLNDVNQHEQHQCPNLHYLYQMSFQDLLNLVQTKIKRVQEDLNQTTIKLKQREDGQFLYARIVGHTIEHIEQLVKKGVKRDTSSFQPIRDSLENDYHKSLELTHKLHWFSIIRLRLKENIASNDKNTNTIRQMVVPSSPIVRLEERDFFLS